MSKYIIDTGDYLFTTDGILVVGFDCDNKPATFYNSLDNLEELNSDYINENFGELQDEAYQRGINDGSLDVKQRVEGAYQKGFEDGKKSTEKGCEGCEYEWCGDTEDPCWHCRRCYKDKYKPALHSDPIKVGDEVIWTTDNITLIVTSMYEVGGINWCDGVAQDGKVYSTLIENDRKTGKHYDIQSILGAMRK